MSPTLNLTVEERKLLKDIQSVRVTDPSHEGQLINSLWKRAVNALECDLICSHILAGITAELAHKKRLREQGAEMKYPNGSWKSWSDLIKKYEKNEKIRDKANKIRVDYRNVWVHPNLEELKTYLKSKGGPITSDTETNIGFASAKEPLEVLKLTAQFLEMLSYTL